jgi:hypothetical protein
VVKCTVKPLFTVSLGGAKLHGRLRDTVIRVIHYINLQMKPVIGRKEKTPLK